MPEVGKSYPMSRQKPPTGKSPVWCEAICGAVQRYRAALRPQQITAFGSGKACRKAKDIWLAVSRKQRRHCGRVASIQRRWDSTESLFVSNMRKEGEILRLDDDGRG
jgi:hypothetical protein